MTIHFPEDHKFYRKQVIKQPTSQVSNLSAYIQQPTHNKHTDIHPLMFRGSPYRSAFVRGIIEHCTKDEIRHLLSIHKKVHDTITKEEQQAELHRTQQ